MSSTSDTNAKPVGDLGREDAVERVAEAINKARYLDNDGVARGLPYRTLSESGPTDRAYCTKLARAALAASPAGAGSVGGEAGPVYGIIDPDYARVFTVARCIAWSEGYALMMHGSFTRDLDLLAVPWTDGATDADHLVRRLEMALDDLSLLVKDQSKLSQSSEKPHGRLSWTFTFKTFGDPRFVDLSVLPRGNGDVGAIDRIDYLERQLAALSAPPAQAETVGEDDRAREIEELAEHLHEERDYSRWTWPTHEDDDGYRGNGLASPDAEVIDDSKRLSHFIRLAHDIDGRLHTTEDLAAAYAKGRAKGIGEAVAICENRGAGFAAQPQWGPDSLAASICLGLGELIRALLPTTGGSDADAKR